MNGRYLLDTNIIIALFAAETLVIEHLRGANEVFLSSVTVGELYYGAYKSGHVTENLARIEDFVIHNIILGCDAETAQQYGVIKNNLRQKGRPIPENDIWIAAIAMQHGLTLVSRDVHFGEIQELNLESW
ncbi:MAG: type II toxin-antitoxin system VapC family toxin [Anaerolineae bacterium]|nr:type II toxin-antitoxin system VapC family toxin [Anaerolineae bacterium]